jgi:site-specific recombinase XerD
MKGCRPLTKPESELVIATLKCGTNGTRNACFFTVGLMTGFRVSELLSLDVSDVFQFDRIVDTVSVKRSSMKGKGEGRTVKLNSKAKAALAVWIEELGGEDGGIPLFCSTARKRISRVQVWRIFNRAFKSINMTGKLGTHCMRKTFADRMHDLLDGDLKQLQGALGHKWITSTSQYLSFKEEKINDALDML